MKERLLRIAAPAGLLALVSLTLGSGFSSTQVFFYRDLNAYFYPMTELAWRMIRAGQLPLWNPYSAYGTPLAAMADTLLFYPVTWLRFLLPFPFGFNFQIIVHFYLAAVATYALGRKLEMSRAAAFAAAAVYTLSGPVLSLGSMINVLVAAAWMPVVLLAARWATERPSVLRILALGATLGMQASGGEPLFGLFTAILAFPLCGVSIPRFLRVLAPAGLFGMALIAVQLIPGLEVLRDSVRATPVFSLSESSFWALHPISLLDLVLPGVLFEQSTNPFRRLLFGVTTPYLTSLYIGLLALALATWALLQSEKREVPWVAAISAGALAFALGQHAAFFSWCYWVVPFVKSSRYPSKTLVVLALGVALLAGWGLDCLKQRRPWRWGWIKWVGAFAVGFALQAALAGPGVTAWATQKTLAAFPPAILAIQGPKLVGMAVLMLLAIMFGTRRPQATTAVVLLVLCVDLALTGVTVNTTAPSELFTIHLPLVDALGGGSPEYRVEAETPAPKLSYPIRDGWSVEALDALETRLNFLYGGALYGVRDARETSPNRLYTPAFHSFWMQMLTWRARKDYRPLADYNIRYVVAESFQKVPPGVHQVAEVRTLTHSMAVWEIEGWRPRAEMEGGTARIVAETPTRVALQVESGKGGTLVLRDSFHRGWRAWVDGAPAEVRPIQTLFRAVSVPPGGHTVEFAYRPWTFFAGAAISLAAVMGWILAAVWGRPRRPAP